MLPFWAIVTVHLAGIPDAIWVGDTLIQGTITDGRAFVAGTLRPRTGVIHPTGGGRLYLAEQFLDGKGDSATTLKTPGVVSGSFVRTPLRWRIDDGRFHYIRFGVPAINQIRALEGAHYGSAPIDVIRRVGSGPPLGDEAFEAAFQASRDGYAGSESNLYKALRGLPNDERKQLATGKGNWVKPWPFPHVDFLPAPGGGYEEYVLTRGALTRWDKDRPPANRLVWTKGPSWAVGWSGPFRVAKGGGDRYVVTADGRAYRLPPASEPAAAPAVVWDGKPILALIDDADTGKSYAFTADQFFELGKDVKPRPHRVGPIPAATAATAEEALGVVARCGRAIKDLHVAAAPATGP
jgi:hypothetical protein